MQDEEYERSLQLDIEREQREERRLRLAVELLHEARALLLVLQPRLAKGDHQLVLLGRRLLGPREGSQVELGRSARVPSLPTLAARSSVSRLAAGRPAFVASA